MGNAASASFARKGDGTEARRVAGEVKRDFPFGRLHLNHPLEEATTRGRGVPVAI